LRERGTAWHCVALVWILCGANGRSGVFSESSCSIIESSARLADCLRILSVQAIYNDETATAQLMTAENVEMHLSLWKTSSGEKHPEGIVVELKRRKDDSITFHRYSRYILDAAVGDFDPEAFTDIESGYTKKVNVC
jgi:hypothetical protein